MTEYIFNNIKMGFLISLKILINDNMQWGQIKIETKGIVDL